MRTGWERKRVADIAQHSLGKMLDKAKNKGEPRPYLRNLNVRWFDFDLSDVLEMRILPSEVERYSVRKGDVLVCEGGYPGRAAIWDRDESIFFQKALHRVRFRDSGIAKWFVYYLRSKDLDGTLSEHFNGSGILHFTGEALARFEVPLPPRDDRERIVNVLDEAFVAMATARANTERNLRNARALFESYRSAVFAQRDSGWIETTVDRLSTNLDGKRIPITKISRKSGEVPYYGASGIVDYVAEHIFEGAALLVSEDGANLLARSTPIAFSVTGKYWVNNHAHVLRFDEAVTQSYVEHYLESIPIDEYVTGAAQPKLTQKALNSIPIPIPVDRDNRARIVERLNAMSAEVEPLGLLYERKLAALDELKRSLLHHAFAGQLTERTAAALGA